MACISISLYSDLLPEPLDWPIPIDTDTVDVQPIADFFSLMVDTTVLTDESTRRHVEVTEVYELSDSDSVDTTTTYLLVGLVAGRTYRVSGSMIPCDRISIERAGAIMEAQGKCAMQAVLHG
jgi:hypothetical protein